MSNYKWILVEWGARISCGMFVPPLFRVLLLFCVFKSFTVNNIMLNSRGHDSVSAETITDFKRTLELHGSCFGLGKYCVAVVNATEFINRCSAAIEKEKLKGSLGLVDYFNEHAFNGNMPEDNLGYQKRSFFSHQREYRVKIDTNKPKPSAYILEVGDLSDIAVITTPAEFNAKWRVAMHNNCILPNLYKLSPSLRCAENKPPAHSSLKCKR